MIELTAERWGELNYRLAGELEAAQHRARASSQSTMRLGVAAAGMLVGVIVLAVALRPADEQVFYFMPAGAVFAVLAWLLMRATRKHGIAQHDVERIQRDIRQWKKRKPGSVFTRKQEPGAQATG